MHYSLLPTWEIHLFSFMTMMRINQMEMYIQKLPYEFFFFFLINKML